MKTILAPVDFSPAGEAVGVEAARLARAIRGRVVLLHVVQPPTVTSEYSPGLENIAVITAEGEKSAAKQLARLQKKLLKSLRSVTTRQFTGLPVAHIVQQAEELGADYIVLGSHGHGALYELLVGSTAQGVIKKASCPIVIVPPRKKQPRVDRKAAQAA
jgi:nucleotide-binding universal stress UspA family protein